MRSIDLDKILLQKMADQQQTTTTTRRPKKIPPPTNNATSNLSTAQQVSNAMERILSVRARTVDLYSQWKSQLQRLSYLVAVMAGHQSNKAIQQCIIDVKSLSSEVPSGLEMWMGLLQNFQVEILNLVLALTLLLMLMRTMNNVNSDEISLSSTWTWAFHWTFLTATTLSAATIGLFFFTEMTRCDALIGTELTRDATMATRRDFPVSVVFYLIVTGAYVFISMGLSKTNRNVVLVRTLQKQLEVDEKLRKRGRKEVQKEG